MITSCKQEHSAVFCSQGTDCQSSWLHSIEFRKLLKSLSQWRQICSVTDSYFFIWLEPEVFDRQVIIIGPMGIGNVQFMGHRELNDTEAIDCDILLAHRWHGRQSGQRFPDNWLAVFEHICMPTLNPSVKIPARNLSRTKLSLKSHLDKIHRTNPLHITFHLRKFELRSTE